MWNNKINRVKITCYFLFASVRLVTREPGRTAGGCPGEQGAGGVREAGEERAGSGIPRVVGTGRN